MESIFFIFLIFASTTLATDTIPAYHFGPDVGDWVRNSAYYISKGIADPVRTYDENDVDSTTPEPTRKIDPGELDTIAGKRGYEVYEYLDDFADARPSNELGKIDPYYNPSPLELNTPVTPNVSDMPNADDNDLAFRTNKPDTTSSTCTPAVRNKALHVALGIRDYLAAISTGLYQNVKELIFNKKGPISYIVSLFVNMFTTPTLGWSVGYVM